MLLILLLSSLISKVFVITLSMCFFAGKDIACLKLCSSVFLVHYEHVFVYFDVFDFKISCSVSLLSILSKFYTLIYSYLLPVLYWLQKKPPEAFFKKSFSLKLRNIYRKTPVLGSLFNKVVALRPATILKRDSNIGVSGEIFKNF